MSRARNTNLIRSQCFECLLKNCGSDSKIHLWEFYKLLRERAVERKALPFSPSQANGWGCQSHTAGEGSQPAQCWPGPDPKELAGTSGKGKADITTIPCPHQVVRPKETGVNLPSSDRLLAVLFGLWSKGFQLREAGWKRKLFLFSDSQLLAQGRSSCSLCPGDCMLVAFTMTKMKSQILHYYFQSPARCVAVHSTKQTLKLRVSLPFSP